MEKLNLSELWNQYSALEENKKLTPTIIRQMVRERSTSKIAEIAAYGYAGVVIYVAVAILFVAALVLYGPDPRYFIVSIAGLILTLVGLAWGTWTLWKIKAIDFMKGNFVQLIDALARAKRMLRFELRAQFVWLPLFLACIFPVMFRMVQGINVFEEFERVALRMLIGYVAATVLSLWLYRRYFFRNIDVMSDELRESEEVSKQ